MQFHCPLRPAGPPSALRCVQMKQRFAAIHLNDRQGVKFLPDWHTAQRGGRRRDIPRSRLDTVREGGNRVPFIAFGPGIKAGSKNYDTGTRDGFTSAERDRIKALEREVPVLRRANEILKLASAFFQGGALV
jgi:hypothetical protein